jgi:hypothetical protein
MASCAKNGKPVTPMASKLYAFHYLTTTHMDYEKVSVTESKLIVPAENIQYACEERVY